MIPATHYGTRVDPARTSSWPDPSSWSALCVVFFADSLQHARKVSVSDVRQTRPFMRRSWLIPALIFLVWLGVPAPARAQTGQSSDLSGCKLSKIVHLSGDRRPVEGKGGVTEIRLLLTGSETQPVQVDCDDMQLFARQMEVFDGHRVVATDDVLFVQGGNRINAERLEFDTKTRTGTFYNAAGSVTLMEKVDRSLFGTQEPDAYFRGEEIHKLGPNRYKIVHGAFTTCVQPTPRWEMVAGSVSFTINDHAFLTNSVLTVKGVPLMYLPIFYYPIEEDDRSTGFLIPIYGTSRGAGQSLSNAFFWAINRSSDATFTYDWYSKTGQGVSSEYRYQLGSGNQGIGTVHFLDEHELTITNADGTTSTRPPQRSYNVNGALSQSLNARWRARANVDYYSDLQTEQRYQQSFAQASTSRRIINGNLTGNWREYVFSGTVEHNDFFNNSDNVTTTGFLPRISFSRGERPIGKSRVYFGVSSEYTTFIQQGTISGVVTNDQGLTRFDVVPYVRIPFTRWPFLTVNSSVGWRDTYWTESIDAVTNKQVPTGISRQFFDFQARITGPTFNRIFNTPGGGYAEKYKHVIEPTVTIQSKTPIDDFNRIVKLDSADSIVGDTTNIIYALNNRLYAKKDVAREIVSVSIRQTYYSNPAGAAFDPSYQSSFNNNEQNHLSALQIGTRVSPTPSLQADFSTEIDPTVHKFTTYTLAAIVNRPRFQARGGWTQRRYIPELPGFSNPALANHDLTGSTSIRSAANHLGGTYLFNYDLHNNEFRNQQITAYYNAQCCGVAVSYQTYNVAGFPSFVLPQDRRFNISFTLAGIGTFSNFFGAFGQGH